MLVARDQEMAKGSGNPALMYTYAIYSKDSLHWSNKIQIGDKGASYATLGRYANGKTILVYCIESGQRGRLMMRKMYGAPALNTLNE